MRKHMRSNCKNLDEFIADKNFIMNPTAPITRVPSKQILIESQSSLLPGFSASLSNLAHDLKKDLNPKLLALNRSFL